MKKKIDILLLSLCMLFVVSACGSLEESQSEDHVMHAMYVTFGEDSSIFIEQENETPFYASFPEEIYDDNGEKITEDQLVKGNIVKITGNGVMAESYPGQYHGITRMDVVEEGNPADADQYRYIIDQIYEEPDRSQPPELNILYTTDAASVSIAATTGGYEWKDSEKNGEEHSVSVEGSHILEWEHLIDAAIGEATELTLHFSENPIAVTVERFPAATWKSKSVDAETLESEVVEVTEGEESWSITAEPGFVYLIRANWDKGQREFGFYTPAE